MSKHLSKLLLLMTFLASAATAEGDRMETIKSIQADIDETVWGPFQRAFETLDGAALNEIYGEEVLRVTPDGIDTDSSFKATNLTRFHENKKRGDKIKLDFWFDSRHTQEDHSYEVGFFRIAITSGDETQVHYGQFHIVLKKIDGHWRITQDWDTSTIAGKPITAEAFESREPAVF